MPTFTKTVTHTARVEQVGDLFCIWMSERPHPFFVHKSVYKPFSKKIERDYDWLAAIDPKSRFFLYPEEVHDFYKAGGLWVEPIRQQYRDEGNEVWVPLDFEEIPENYDEKNVLRLGWGDHRVETPFRDTPISSPFGFRLMSGYFDVPAAEAHLEKDPRVTLFDEGGGFNKLIVVLLPQPEWDGLMEKFSKDGYPEGRVRDCCQFASEDLVAKGFPDILGLAQFRKPEPDPDDEDWEDWGY